MTTAKKIIASLIALPMLIGSVSAIADEQKMAEGKPAHHMMATYIFDGVNLSQEQKDKLKANMEKLVKTPGTMELDHEKPDRKARMQALLEGVDLTQEQKTKLFANIEAQMKRVKDKVSQLAKENPEQFEKIQVMHQMSGMLKDVDLSDAQKEVVKTNLIKMAKEAKTLDVKGKTNVEDLMKEIFAGVELTSVQKEKIKDNFAKRPQARG